MKSLITSLFIANKFNEYFSTAEEKLMEKIPYTTGGQLNAKR